MLPRLGARVVASLGALLLLHGSASAGEQPLLRAAIEIARRDHKDLDEAVVRGEIDRLTARYLALCGDDPTPAEAADGFRKLLFLDQRFESVADLTSSKTLHLDSVLRTRRGYCLSLSVVALAIAEKAGVPLHGVAAPNHFFVRYRDGEFSRNLELTRGGVEISDEKMREDLGPQLLPGSIYLRDLTLDEIRACLLHNRGFVALSHKRFESARRDFESAIALAPNLNEAHRNLGVLWGERGRSEKAKTSFIRAIALYPGDVDALINLAIARRALGEHEAAIQDLEMALVLDPAVERADALRLKWTKPEPTGAVKDLPVAALPAPPAKLAAGLLGRYYAGTGFETLKRERVDDSIDFDWQNGAPDQAVPRDRFSIRWEGYFKATSAGTYTFFVAANDGVRVEIGGTRIIDNWRNMAYRNFYGSKEIRLEAGWHAIKIEHFDVMGGARLLLRIGLDGREAPLDAKRHFFHVPPKK
ncbi:MAG: PA14 domain-containing protein [Planctomycetota bacterium]